MTLSDKALEIGRALDLRDTVLFVGSGLSTWSGLPNWSRLIGSLITFVENKTGTTQTAARRSSSQGDLLAAADYLVSRLKAVELAEFFNTDLRFPLARPSQVHELLSRLGPTCLLTTNYDRLIETQFEKSNPLRVITNRQVADFADIVRSDAKNFLFKLHGTIDDSASIVLSESNYYDIIINSRNEGSPFCF